MPRVTVSANVSASPPPSITDTPAAKNANTGTATPADTGPEPVLEVLGQSGAGARRTAQDRYGEAEQHPGDGGVHPRLVHQYPGGRGQWQQQPPVPHAALDEQGEGGQRDQGQRERQQVQRGRVEDRDDRDREQVVDDRESQQEHPQCGRQVGAEQGQDGEGERDVGGGGDRPSGQRGRPTAHVEQHVEQGRCRHATDGCGDRQGGAAGVAQVAGDELAFEFEPGHEEEDRQ